jgi:hypothetical protein
MLADEAGASGDKNFHQRLILIRSRRYGQAARHDRHTGRNASLHDSGRPLARSTCARAPRSWAFASRTPTSKSRIL